MSSVSTTARAGNVLVLLDLYASGFGTATASPTIPMLTSRTMYSLFYCPLPFASLEHALLPLLRFMHALYAVSLLVYSMDSLLNWVHVHSVLQGQLSSFSLHLWFLLLLVVVAVSGSMLILLLVMLCIENAFAHRLDITVHKSGLTVVWEAFTEWVHGFNNFRIAFLFMALHDAPLTLANFFLLIPCRCSGPQVLRWPLLLSVLSISCSLCWRLLLLYFAYSRLVFPSRRKGSSAFPSRNQSFRNQLAQSGTSANEGPQLDECWPLRWSSTAVYGDSSAGKGGCCGPSTFYLDADPSDKHSLAQFCGFWLSWVALKGTELVCALLRRVLCLLSTLLLSLACLAIGCTPCVHYYTCRRNSLSHRHKCAKTFVRRCTLLFHYGVFTFSLLLSIWLILLNLVLLSSVHLVGPNNWPPEISRLCISVDPSRRLVRPLLLPAPSMLSPFWPSAEHSLSGLSQCKPLWDLSQSASASFPFLGWAPGLARVSPGQWQARVPLGDGSVLAVSTHFLPDQSDHRHSSPQHTILYDFALLHFGADNSSRTALCARRQFSGWFFANRPNQLGFPYFLACSSSFRIRRASLIDCQALTRRRKGTTSATRDRRVWKIG